MTTARTLDLRTRLLRGARGREALWIAWQRAAPGIVSLTTVLVDGIAGGGYFPRAWRLTSFALLAFGLAALVGRREIAPRRIERGFLGLVAGLTAWTAASTIWSDTSGTSILEGERDVVYLSAVAAVLLCVRRESVPVLLGGVLAGITVVAGYGLFTYVVFDHPLNPIQGKLLFEPLGYANGLGIYAAIGTLLAVGLALALRPPLLRLACLAPVAILVPSLYLTDSRAAELSLAVGLVVFVRFSRRLSRALTGAFALVAAAAVAVVVAASLPQEHSLVTGLFGANRPRYWHVAWREVTLNPVLGSGAGTFERYWLLYRPVGPFARDAHNLYLETLAELGPVGLALLVAALGLPLLVLRGRRDPLVATAAAGYVSVLVATRGHDAPEVRLPQRLCLFAAALGLALLALIRLKTGSHLPFAS